MKLLIAILMFLVFAVSANAETVRNTASATSRDSIVMEVRCLDSLGEPSTCDSFWVFVIKSGTDAAVWSDSGTTSMTGLDVISYRVSATPDKQIYYFHRAVQDIDGAGAEGQYVLVAAAQKVYVSGTNNKYTHTSMPFKIENYIKLDSAIYAGKFARGTDSANRINWYNATDTCWSVTSAGSGKPGVAFRNTHATGAAGSNGLYVSSTAREAGHFAATHATNTSAWGLKLSSASNAAGAWYLSSLNSAGAMYSEDATTGGQTGISVGWMNANSINSGSFAANAITAAAINTDAITSDEIAVTGASEIADAAGDSAWSITVTSIANRKVTTDGISANAITAASINTDAITSDEIAATGAAEIADASGDSAWSATVTSIANRKVTTDAITDGAIATADFASGATIPRVTLTDSAYKVGVGGDGINAASIAASANQEIDSGVWHYRIDTVTVDSSAGKITYVAKLTAVREAVYARMVDTAGSDTSNRIKILPGGVSPDTVLTRTAAGGSGATAQEVWEYATRTITDSANQTASAAAKVWATGTKAVTAIPNATVGGYAANQDPATLLLTTPASKIINSATGVTVDTVNKRVDVGKIGGQTATAAAPVAFPAAVGTSTFAAGDQVTVRTILDSTQVNIGQHVWNRRMDSTYDDKSFGDSLKTLLDIAASTLKVQLDTAMWAAGYSGTSTSKQGFSTDSDTLHVWYGATELYKMVLYHVGKGPGSTDVDSTKGFWLP